MGAAVDRLLARFAGPADEARDDHGRWSAGGVSGPEAFKGHGSMVKSFQTSRMGHYQSQGWPDHLAAKQAESDAQDYGQQLGGAYKSGGFTGTANVQVEPARPGILLDSLKAVEADVSEHFRSEHNSNWDLRSAIHRASNEDGLR